MAQFGALLISLVLLFAHDQARWGFLPGPAALSRLRELATQGREFAISAAPPAGPDPGLLFLLVAGIGLAALVVDTLAAGLDLPGMTLIPLAALFAVPWVIQEGSAPGWTFVVVAAGWLAVVSALQGDRARRWSRGARAGSPGTGVAIAGAATALALLAGGLTGLRGPQGSLDFATAFGTGTGDIRLDALVSLRRSLVENDDRPVITMATTATRPEYLRLAILELFDGEHWRPIGPNDTGPQPPQHAAASAPREPAEYRLDVGPLAGPTLPSPAGSFSAVNDTSVTWDQRTSLPLRADGSSIEGSRVALRVDQPAMSTAALRAASRVPPSAADVFSENLADPTPLTGPELPRLAREITADSATPFDAGVDLQRWFTTDGGFSYSTDVPSGSGEDALAAFLEDRVGYCEQFAATMALMARSVGIPARVAVGFTQGRQDRAEWVIRGTDAHAWPELWMGSAGWVRFEPTPGAPTTTTPTYTTGGADPATPTSAPTQSSAEPSQAASVDPGRLPDDGTDGASGQASEAGLPLRWIALAFGLLLLTVPAGLRIARRRRRLSRGDGESAYQEVIDTLVDLRLGEQAPTPRATLAVVTGLVGSAGSRDPAATAQAVERILRAVEWQRYGRPGESGGSGAVGPGRRGRDVGGSDHACRPGGGAGRCGRPAGLGGAAGAASGRSRGPGGLRPSGWRCGRRRADRAQGAGPPSRLDPPGRGARSAPVAAWAARMMPASKGCG